MLGFSLSSFVLHLSCLLSFAFLLQCAGYGWDIEYYHFDVFVPYPPCRIQVTETIGFNFYEVLDQQMRWVDLSDGVGTPNAIEFYNVSSSEVYSYIIYQYQDPSDGWTLNWGFDPITGQVEFVLTYASIFRYREKNYFSYYLIDPYAWDVPIANLTATVTFTNQSSTSLVDDTSFVGYSMQNDDIIYYYDRGSIQPNNYWEIKVAFTGVEEYTCDAPRNTAIILLIICCVCVVFIVQYSRGL